MDALGLAFSFAAILLTVGFLGWLLRNARRGDPARVAEDEARRYFDAHGHWPDER